MDTVLQKRFVDLWRKYFGDAELPIGFYFSETAGGESSPVRCVMAAMKKVREGEAVFFSKEEIKCFGAKAYLGYTDDHVPSEEGQDYTFTEMFLAAGIPGKVEGERLKESPETCRRMYRNSPAMTAPADHLVFKRWDLFAADEMPEVVIFFAKSDVLSALYNLANYDAEDVHGVIAPWGSGCSSIISDPWLQSREEKPKAVMGSLDIAARPFLEPDVLSLAMPAKRLFQLMEYMDASFLTTKAWEVVKKRND